MSATDQESARTVIGAGTSSLSIGTTEGTAKSGDYQPSSSDVSDATTIGRQVITATDAEAVRNIIGSGTSSLSIGTTSTTAKRGDYQPASSDITDASPLGKSLITISDASAARALVGAGTSSLSLGLTSTTAKAGDYAPSAASITDSGAVGQSIIKSSTTTAAMTAVSGNAPDAAKYLRGDGTWQTPTNTTYSDATQSASGLMSAADKTKLDGIESTSVSAVASGGRPIGTAFTISSSRNARCTYSFSYTLTATLSLGQTVTLIATVDGVEVCRFADGILLGLAGAIAQAKTLCFDVPAGKQVLFTKSGSSAVTVSLISGQETLIR